MTTHLIDVLTAAAVARAFGPDMRWLVRRVLAAGVRLGTSELVQARHGEGREGGR